MDIWMRRGVPLYPADGDGVLPRHVEVAIVGGGMTGVLTAHALMERDVNVAVFEAWEVGRGGSGSCLGALTLGGELALSQAARLHGTEGAELSLFLMREAINTYRMLAARYGLRATPVERNVVLYTRRREAALEYEAELSREVGLEAALGRRSELPFSVSRTLSYPAAWIHPTLFLYGIARQVPLFAGVRISRCAGHTLFTTDGDEIDADVIVFASRTIPQCDFMPYLPQLSFLHAHVLSLEGRSPMKHMYSGIDTDGIRAISVGEDTVIAAPPTHAAHPRSIAAEYFPSARIQEAREAWDVQTPDGLPVIGQVTPLLPHLYIATGFGGMGLCHAATAAELIAASVFGEAHPAEWLYAPCRTSIIEPALRRAEAAEEFMPLNQRGADEKGTSDHFKESKER